MAEAIDSNTIYETVRSAVEQRGQQLSPDAAAKLEAVIGDLVNNQGLYAQNQDHLNKISRVLEDKSKNGLPSMNAILGTLLTHAGRENGTKTKFTKSEKDRLRGAYLPVLDENNEADITSVEINLNAEEKAAPEPQITPEPEVPIEPETGAGDISPPQADTPETITPTPDKTIEPVTPPAPEIEQGGIVGYAAIDAHLHEANPDVFPEDSLYYLQNTLPDTLRLNPNDIEELTNILQTVPRGTAPSVFNSHEVEVITANFLLKKQYQNSPTYEYATDKLRDHLYEQTFMKDHEEYMTAQQMRDAMDRSEVGTVIFKDGQVQRINPQPLETLKEKLTSSLKQKLTEHDEATDLDEIEGTVGLLEAGIEDASTALGTKLVLTDERIDAIVDSNVIRSGLNGSPYDMGYAAIHSAIEQDLYQDIQSQHILHGRANKELHKPVQPDESVRAPVSDTNARLKAAIAEGEAKVAEEEKIQQEEADKADKAKTELEEQIDNAVGVGSAALGAIAGGDKPKETPKVTPVDGILTFSLKDISALQPAFEKADKLKQFEALQTEYQAITSNMKNVPNISISVKNLDEAIAGINPDQTAVEQSGQLINGILNRTERTTSMSVFDDFTTALDKTRATVNVNLEEARLQKALKDNPNLQSLISNAVNVGGAGIAAAEETSQTKEAEQENDSKKLSFKQVNKVTGGTALVAGIAGLGLLANSSKKEQQVDQQTGQVQETKKPNWFKRILGVGVLIAAVAVGRQAMQGKGFAEMELLRRQNKGTEPGLGK